MASQTKTLRVLKFDDDTIKIDGVRFTRSTEVLNLRNGTSCPKWFDDDGNMVATDLSKWFAVGYVRQAGRQFEMVSLDYLN
jgi:hypothetical protein